MENLDILVLKTLYEWRSRGESAVLATVTRTWGSSPRPLGSIMALHESGSVVGSVSGGCIEDDLIRRYSGNAQRENPALPPEAPRSVQYGVSAEEAHRFGLPCGGTLELVLEFNPDAERLKALLDELSRGRLVLRSLCLQTGEVGLSPTSAPAALTLTDSHLTSCFGPGYRMLLIGAGQMAEYLASMARFCGFQVTVCEPRPEYRYGWGLSDVPVLTQWPDDVVKAFGADRRSCVIALTHDPKMDDLALMEALTTEAFYVGAIGSRRNHASRKGRLIEHFGYTEHALERLRGPVGIFIGSKTPAEIAVSIMSEVLAVKNGVTLPRDLEVAYAKTLSEKGRIDP